MKRAPRMSNARQLKSGQSRRLRTLDGSSEITVAHAHSFLSILKRAAPALHALDSLPDETLHLLFHSMTKGERGEAIGILRSLNDNAGSLFVRSLRLRRYANCSKTVYTTLHSSSDPTESE